MSSKIKFKDVAYFSSEHPKNSVKNLLSGTGNWTTPSNSKLNILEAEFSLACPSSITGIDVGNYWSASLEILVGMSEWPQSRREVLLTEHVFMNRIDCSVGENKQKMMFFREAQFCKEVLDKKWDRVKVVCKQPFKYNNDVFGLGMLVMHGKTAPAKVEVSKHIQGSEKCSSSSKNPGLAEFMKKAGNMASSSQRPPKVTSVLKNLENQKRVVETDSSGSVSFSNSFNASAMSRTAKLVVEGQNLTGGGRQPSGFEKEAGQFLRECQFEKKTFAEIETVTFRNVKELWMKKKGAELKKEEKDILKTLSSQYLSKLVNRNMKRSRDGDSENLPPKKRKVSEQIQSMRKNIDIVDVIEDDNSSMRNRIATMDMEKPKISDSDEDDPDIVQLRNKFKKTKPGASSSKILKTPPTLSKKLAASKNKSPNTSSGWIGKTKTPDRKEIPNFDLNFSPEMSPKVPTPKAVKASSPTPPKPKVQTNTVPNYNRKHLLTVPHKDLIKSGVLVQVYNYKKDKKLPLKGGIELSVSKAEPVTFFKVGPDIHLEYKNRFYLPDIKEEHMERVFKNFSPKEISSKKFPDNIEKLLKMSGQAKHDTTRKSENSKGAKSDLFDEKLSPVKLKASNVKNSSSEVEKGQCPICSTMLPLMKLADHAADCEVLLSDSEECGGGGGG